MAKQNKLIKVALVTVAIAGVGLATWQNYELRMERKKEKFHAAHSSLRGAYFLYTTQQQIDIINKENDWDEMKTRDSFLIWLSYTHESLVNANSTLNDFPSLVSFQDRTNINDISDWYSQWWVKVSNILVKPGPLTSEDKSHISKLSSIVSKVDGFYPHELNDWDGISASFVDLHKEWKKTIEKQ